MENLCERSAFGIPKQVRLPLQLTLRVVKHANNTFKLANHAHGHQLP